MLKYGWLLLLVLSCARQVTRIDPSTPKDLSGRWNDTDSRQVADWMIEQFNQSERFKEYKKSLGRNPVVVVGTILNKTTEHIDADTFLNKIEVALFNSGIVDMAESGVFRDKIREERISQQDFADPNTVKKWGKEVGADLMLFGELTSQTDFNRNERVISYSTTLYLTDMETNKRVWYGNKEIKKMIRR